MKEKPTLPIGERESQTLEFKGVASIKSKEGLKKIAKEIVGMLNAKDGYVWVGMAEDPKDKDVARNAEHIEDVQAARTRLRDHLVEKVEPQLEEGEVDIRVVNTPGGDVLCIEVKGKARNRPYAQISGSARSFPLRIDGRNRPMDRPEIARAFVKAAALPGAGMVRREVGKRNEWAVERGANFKMVLLPERDLDLNSHWLDVKQLLVEPELTGNRKRGGNFSAPHGEPEVGQNRWVFGAKGGPRISVTKTGHIEFEVPLRALSVLGRQREFDQTALLEYPTSLMRLARVLNGLAGVGGKVDWGTDLVITGLKGWHLVPDGSAELELPNWQKRPAFPKRLFQLDQPIWITASDLEAKPDACAFRVYKQVYEAFGQGEEAIPATFDRKTGRLNL